MSQRYFNDILVAIGNHSKGHSELSMLMHTLLVYVAIACALFVLLEHVNRNNVTWALLRSWAILLQGVWFCCIGLIVHPPSPEFELKLDPNDPTALMTIPLIFAGMLLVVLLFQTMLGFIFFFRVKSQMNERGIKYSIITGKVEKKASDDQFLLEEEESSDEENINMA